MLNFKEKKVDLVTYTGGEKRSPFLLRGKACEEGTGT